MASNNRLQLIPLTIEKYAPPGNGLGFYRDKAVFVPRGVVGDELLVRIEKEKKRYIIGSLEKVVKPAPQRCQPLCCHYEECGGCDLLQFSAADQLNLKKEMLTEVLAGVGISGPLDMIAAPEIYAYRHRAVFHCDQEKNIGFLQRRSHRIVAVPDCMVLAPGLKKLLQKLVENPGLLPDGLTTCYALANRAGDFAAMGCRGRFRSGNLESIRTVSEIVIEDYGFGRLELAASGFAQVNPQVVGLIIRDLVNHCVDLSTVAELYGGSGTFSLPLAQVVKSLMVYESDAAAVARGRSNAELNNLTNISFISGRAEKIVFTDLLDALVVDPPRVGLHADVVDNILRSPARKLVYISCNPATLARDLARLKTPVGNFTLTSIKAYDMYPGTTHLEVMAVLQRSH